MFISVSSVLTRPLVVHARHRWTARLSLKPHSKSCAAILAQASWRWPWGGKEEDETGNNQFAGDTGNYQFDDVFFSIGFGEEEEEDGFGDEEEEEEGGGGGGGGGNGGGY